MDGLCPKAKVSGYFTPGTFQQYCLGPANYVTPIPDLLPSADAAPFLCAGLTTYSALRKFPSVAGNWIVISGAGGGLGHMAVQIAAKAMCRRVIGIVVGAKKDFVLGCGAETFFDLMALKGDELVKEVIATTGGSGAHAVLCVSAAMQAYEDGVKMLRSGGTLVCVGMPEGEQVGFYGAFPTAVAGRGISIIGSAVGNRAEAQEVLDLAARGVVKTTFTVEKMENLQDVFERMNERKLVGRVVLDLQ